MRFNLSISCVVVLFTVGALLGQEAQRERISEKGTIKAARNGILQIMGENGDQWLVKVEASRPEYVRYSASAVPGWLSPGMIVEFTGAFTKRGKPVSEVRSIRVVTPTEENPVGVKPVTSGGGGVGGTNDLFSTGEKKKKKTRRPTTNSANYRVTGMLRSIKNGKMVIAAGRMPVQAELAKDAKVHVEVSDPRFLQVGDSVEFDGWYNAGDVTRVVANRITITAANTLGEEPERPSRSKRRSSSRSRKK